MVFHVDNGAGFPKAQAAVIDVEAEEIDAKAVGNGFNSPFVNGN